MSINGVGYNPYIYTALKAAANSQLNSAQYTSVPDSLSDELILNNSTASPRESSATFSEQLKAELQETKEKQGFIGKLWDGFKNLTHIGAGSNKAQNAIEKFEKGEISAEDAQKAVENYKKGQNQCVDMVADVAAGITAFAGFALATGAGIAAAPFTGGASLGLVAAGFGIAFGAGAVTKTAIKGIDAAVGGREYGGKEIFYDIATGGINGMFAPITAGIGGAAGKAVASRVGVQAVREGGEIVVSEALKGTVRGAVTKTMLTTSVKYTGGSMAARGFCLAADMAVNGAVSGAVDSSVRYLAGDEKNKSLEGLLQNTTQGAIGGFIAAPIIGGGMRLAGYGIGKVTNNINKKITFDRVMPDGVETTIKQGATGDCHVVSAIDGMLNNPKTSKLIKKAILTTPDGNYQVKIGNEMVTVAKNSIPDGLLSDVQGVRILEQAYKQLNNGNLDGGFADVVAKQFGLDPVHILNADLSDDVIRNIAKEQGNFVLSAGIETGGQRHYLSVRNIDTEKGIITLVDPTDTSKVIQKSLAEFKSEVISLDGGSIGKVDLPNSLRDGSETVFRGTEVFGGVDDTVRAKLKTFNISEAEFKKAVDVYGDVRAAEYIESLALLRENISFYKSNPTLEDAISIIDKLDNARQSVAVEPFDLLTSYERGLSEEMQFEIACSREGILQDRANLDKVFNSLKVDNAQSIHPDNLLRIKINGKDRYIYCQDTFIKNAGNMTPAELNAFVENLAKSNLITEELLGTYRTISELAATDSRAGAVLKAFKGLGEVEVKYQDGTKTVPLEELFKRAGTNFSDMSSPEIHAITDVFYKQAKVLENDFFCKELLKSLKTKGSLDTRFKQIAGIIKAVQDKCGTNVELSDHAIMRLLDRNLLNPMSINGEVMSFEAFLQHISKNRAELLKSDKPIIPGVKSLLGTIISAIREDSKTAPLRLVSFMS